MLAQLEALAGKSLAGADPRVLVGCQSSRGCSVSRRRGCVWLSARGRPCPGGHQAGPCCTAAQRVTWCPRWGGTLLGAPPPRRPPPASRRSGVAVLQPSSGGQFCPLLRKDGWQGCGAVWRVVMLRSSAARCCRGQLEGSALAVLAVARRSQSSLGCDWAQRTFAWMES